MSTELDKFKRRVIRSVARVLRSGPDKQPDDKLWDALQKEVGCDCKLLWERMRTLTLKKMKRLLPADDKLRVIADVAQMQLTDWLLFDLVLVHEDIDVISDDPNSKAMKDLVHLVQMFEIEGKSGDSLTTAWTAATFYYNSFGRQCSPMLLQRRWYQLKKSTRSKFYTFWYEYRGNARLLEIAKKAMPNELNSLIAQRYPYVITNPFKEWSELIREKFVILPEEFEAKMRSKNAIPKQDKNEPDIVLVEPQIETIDLGVDSDSETEDSKKELQNQVKIAPTISIKKEIELEDEIDLDAVDATENNESQDSEEKPDTEVIDVIDKTNDEDDDDVMICETNGANQTPTLVKTEVARETVDNRENDQDVLLNEGSGNIEIVKKEVRESSDDVEEVTDNVETINDTVEQNNERSPMTADEETLVPQNEEVVMPQIINVFGNVHVPAEKLAALQLNKPTTSSINESQSMNADENVEEIIRRKAIQFTTDTMKEELITKDLGLTDDHVAVVEPHETPPVKETSVVLKESISEVIEPLPSPIDVKVENMLEQFGNVPSDTTFVDDGIEFVDDGIEFDEEDDDYNEAPKTAIEPSEEPPKFDVKLLMQPIVYSVKLDSMKVFKNKDIDSVSDKQILETALMESKPIFPKPVLPSVKEELDVDNEPPPSEEHTQSNSSESEEDEIPEEMRVKPNSYLLQKPRSRSYNPIQLCKNPDFNTRLKRLTFGFLSSMRNRAMLKTLKPMTIDLSKTFEGKLINGTMYLKRLEGPVVKQEPIIEDTSASIAVIPSAMPVQSIIDNIDARDVLLPAPPPITHKPTDSILNERQRTINLPDINHIRRINQQLLTAEVTPMRSNLNNDKYEPPVRLVLPQNKEPETNVENDLKPNVKVDILPPEVEKPIVEQKTDIAYKDVLEKDKVIDQVIPAKPATENEVSAESISNTVTSASNATSSNTNTVTSKASQGYAAMAADAAKRRKNSFKPKPAPRLPWTKPQVPIRDIGVDSLLTIDTLQKMLDVISYSDHPTDIKAKKWKKKSEKKRLQLEKQLDQYMDKIKSGDNFSNETTETKTVASGTDELELEPPVKKQKCSKTKRKKAYEPFCCWARMKLVAEEKANATKHFCPRICNCCCREELAIKTKWTNSSSRKQSEIIISDEESGKTNEKQANKNKAMRGSRKRGRRMMVPPVETGPKEVSIQCDMPEAEISLSDLLETAAALTNIPSATKEVSPTKPLIRIVRKPVFDPPPDDVISLDDVDDGSVRLSPSLGRHRRKTQDLSTKTQFTVPMLTHGMVSTASKVQGHIIIDGTNKLTVQNKMVNKVAIPRVPTGFKVKMGNARQSTIYINNKTLGKDVISPIFLGKNKILLTDIKFPSNLGNDTVDYRQIIEQQPTNESSGDILPPGVQLVLLPSGVVTYTLKMGAVLSDEEKATLPAIVLAVQEQLKATGTLPNYKNSIANLSDAPILAENVGNENVTDLTNEDDLPPSISEESTQVLANQPEKYIQRETETNKSEIAVDTLVCEEDSKTETININNNSNVPENVEAVSNVMQLHSVGEIACDVESYVSRNKPASEPMSEEIPDHTNNVQNENVAGDRATPVPSLLCTESTNIDDVEKMDATPTVINEGSHNTVTLGNAQEHTPKEQNNRKSLLSDLMQMSGIWDDDIDSNVPATNENTNVGTEIPTDLNTGIAAPEILSQGEMSAVQPVLDTTGDIDMTQIITPSALNPDRTIPELTPVTSLKQLKYACENHGNFFKLDLALGTLSCGIKVCIKKQMPKSVIDLTEDDGDDVTEAQITQEPPDASAPKPPVTYSLPPNLSRSLLKLGNPGESVKPIKLFRSVRILKNNKEQTVLLPANTEAQSNSISNTNKQKRKQNIDVRNGIVEVLDENSLDSEELNQYIYKDSDFLNSPLDSFDGDSSDDEPLASKAKRMREDESSSAPMDEPDVRPNIESLEVERPTTSENLELTEMDSNIYGSNQPAEKLMDDDLNDLSENMVQELPKNLMAFMPDNLDDDEDDNNGCILGV